MSGPDYTHYYAGQPMAQPQAFFTYTGQQAPQPQDYYQYLGPPGPQPQPYYQYTQPQNQQQYQQQHQQQYQPPPPAGEQPPQQARQRITHHSEAAIAHYAALPLESRLYQNSIIEQNNETINRRYTDYLTNPGQQPPPSNDTASFLTIRDDEWAVLQDPAFVSGLNFQLPHFVRAILAKTQALAQSVLGSSSKRKRGRDNDTDDEGEQRRPQRRFADSERITSRVPGHRQEMTFHETFYTSAVHTHLPLSMFIIENVHFINNNIGSSTIPTTKCPTDSKDDVGGRIFCVDKIQEKFPLMFKDDADLSLPEWDQAADNHCKFEISRDKDGAQGAHAQMFADHYAFFAEQPDRIALFEFWLPIEIDIRAKLRTSPAYFDLSHYEREYQRAVHARDTVRIMSSMSHTPTAPLRSSAPTRSFSLSPTKPRPEPRHNRSFQNTTDFRTSSISKPPALSGIPSLCIGCGESGHGVTAHYSADFKGTPLRWARTRDRDLICGDKDDVICIAWNISGSDRRCKHGSTRVHVCALCGGAHPALRTDDCPGRSSK